MSDRQAALSALMEQLNRAVTDPMQILDDQAARAAEQVRAVEAARVAASGSDPGVDVEVAHALGWYHWLRFGVLPSGPDQGDRAEAARLFTAVYPAAPDAVPEPLRMFFDVALAGDALTSGNAAELGGRAVALVQLYENYKRREFLELAVPFARAAVAAASADDDASILGLFLHTLGRALQALYDHTGDLATLVEAVQFSRAAVAAPPLGPDSRAMYLDTFGTALQLLYEGTGELPVLYAAVQAGRDAVAAVSSEDRDRTGFLTNLAAALHVLFERTGELAVLDEAIQTVRDAVDATPTEDPSRAGRLSNLSGALKAMFKQTGELAMLIEAVQAGREAVAATPTDDPDRPTFLGNLAGTLQLLFDRTGELGPLIEAVEVGREAVAAIPANHPARATPLSNLAGALRSIFERTGELAVLVETVQAVRDAIAATPADHIVRRVLQNNLALVLQMLFERTGESAALDEAIQASRAAIAATPADHPEHATYVYSLGMSLDMSFERARDLAVLAEARDCYRQAGSNESGATYVRIAAHRRFALMSVEAGEAVDGLRSMDAAVELIYRLAPGSLARTDREHQIGRLADIPAEAAGVALAAGFPDRAIELLERTRGILAADTMGLRGGEPTRLRTAGHDALADRLEELRARLDAFSWPGATAPTEGDAARTAQQSARDDRLVADQRRAAHAEWADLLEEIRAQPGFGDFFRAPPLDVLAGWAHGGPVVYVAAGDTRADALILTDTADPVCVVPLPALTHEAAGEQANRLAAAYRTVGLHDVDPASRKGAQQEILTILAWLWDAIAEPVLTVLGYTAASATDEAVLPRLWWCPVGVLAFLPLHAAGHHSEPVVPGAVPRCVADRVVSSYTPTARALARAGSDDSAESPNMLIVPVADLPNAELPGVDKEAAAIKALIPEARVLQNPTRAAVLEGLPAYQIAHFSCHGYVDWEQPTLSRLLLSDYATSPLIMADITAVHLDAELAFLSACSTSVTAPRLIDESLHITGAFQLAGYRQVIGTLWPIDDGAAAQIASDFYSELTDGGSAPPRLERAAHALHRATTRLRRRYPEAPSLWTAHIHTGTDATRCP